MTVLTYYDGEKPESDPFQEFLESEIKPFGILRNSPYLAMDDAATRRHKDGPADAAVVETLSRAKPEALSDGKSSGEDIVSNGTVTEGEKAAKAPTNEIKKTAKAPTSESKKATIALINEGNRAATNFLRQPHHTNLALAFSNAGPYTAETSAYARYVSVEMV